MAGTSYGRRHARLAQAPAIAGLTAVSVGLTGFLGPADECALTPCADYRGGEAMVLPPDFGLEPIPTQANYTPVITVQAPASGGTALAGDPGRRWGYVPGQTYPG
jgi:hypothetical protein